MQKTNLVARSEIFSQLKQFIFCQCIFNKNGMREFGVVLSGIFCALLFNLDSPDADQNIFNCQLSMYMINAKT